MIRSVGVWGAAIWAMLIACAGMLAAQTPTRTVWDGVYSQAQATRGRSAFVRSCGGCHRDDASGGDDAEPPLRGPNFLHKWDDTPLAALYDFVATNMPRNKPGSVSLEDCVDIVAYLLQLNEMPDGTAELNTDIKAMAAIQIVMTRPAR